MQTDRLQTDNTQTEDADRERVQTDRVQTDRMQTDSMQAERMQTERVQTDSIETETVQTHIYIGSLIAVWGRCWYRCCLGLVLVWNLFMMYVLYVVLARDGWLWAFLTVVYGVGSVCIDVVRGPHLFYEWGAV